MSPRHLGRVARLGALIWFLVRATASVAVAVTVGPAQAITPSFLTSVLIIATTGALVNIEQRRSRSRLLQANLGAAPGWIWAAALLPAGALELAGQIVLR